jgi:hypothetical protein
MNIVMPSTKIDKSALVNVSLLTPLKAGAIIAVTAMYMRFMNSCSPTAEHAAVGNDGRWAKKVRTSSICLSEISSPGVIINTIK